MVQESRSHRRFLFAVWRWPKWAWAALLLMLPIAYVGSAVPILTLLVELKIYARIPAVFAAVEAMYAPVFWAGKHSEFIGLVIAWEQSVMLSWFGRSI